MALLYTAFGTMQFNGIISGNYDGVLYPMVIAGFGMMVVGVGFKLALVPFHMWTPDVYQGASAPVTAFVATASKGAVMAVLIRFFFNFRGFDDPYLFIVISAIAILSMSIGNLLAIRQQNLKRLLAYSSIANMGYLVIILLVGSGKGIQAAIFYMLSYFITTIGAFGVISALSNCQKEADQVEDYKGLFWKNPWLALVFTLIMLSLAGIPITAGFMAKFYIVLEGMNAGLMVLVFAMILNSIFGLYYYLRVITAFFSAADEEKLPALSLTSNITLAFITISILLLGIYPGWLLEIISRFTAF
jgi:NADH-quinone oxidoreductase subunit N